MACPYFLPLERLDGGWLHSHRLPLGCGWSGQCTAPGHENQTPSDDELRELCNLGYASRCPRLPQDRAWDSIRFGARVLQESKDNARTRIQIRYICERDHLPAAHGSLIFNTDSKCEQVHPDARLQKLAECFLQSYVQKINRTEVDVAVA